MCPDRQANVTELEYQGYPHLFGLLWGIAEYKSMVSIKSNVLTDIISWNGLYNMTFNDLVKRIYGPEFIAVIHQFRWYDTDRRLIKPTEWTFFPHGFCLRFRPDFKLEKSHYYEIASNESFVVYVVDRVRILYFSFSQEHLSGARMFTPYDHQTQDGVEKHYRHQNVEKTPTLYHCTFSAIMSSWIF